MERANLSGKRAAHVLGWSETKVSRMLTGRQVFKDTDVSALLALCSVTGDEKERLLELARQYDQQPNQVLCSVARRNWTDNGDDSNIFGLEPNFGCCTANLLTSPLTIPLAPWHEQRFDPLQCGLDLVLLNRAGRIDMLGADLRAVADESAAPDSIVLR